MLKITIPAPCYQDWDKMLINEQGRHCNACSKTVVDFTVMNDDELYNFFLLKKEEKICGKFSNKQLSHTPVDLPSNIFRIELPLWKRFLAAALIVFGSTLFSCTTRIKYDNNDPAVTKPIPVADLKDSSNMTVGLILPPIERTAVFDTVCTLGEVIPEIPDSLQQQLTGTVSVRVCNPDSVKEVPAGEKIKADSIPAQRVDFIGKPALQIKDLPKADSTNMTCDSIPTIYS